MRVVPDAAKVEAEEATLTQIATYFQPWVKVCQRYREIQKPALKVSRVQSDAENETESASNESETQSAVGNGNENENAKCVRNASEEDY